MRVKGLMIVGALTLLSLSAAKAAEDLSGFGMPLDGPGAKIANQTTRGWAADVCSEIQRIEKMVIEDARPVDRGMLRYGLLILEMKHCGIDVSKKFTADQAALEEVRRQSNREFEENLAVARREASHPRQPIIVQVPQAPAQSSQPDPSPPVSCFTTRLGGGMSTTNCR